MQQLCRIFFFLLQRLDSTIHNSQHIKIKYLWWRWYRFYTFYYTLSHLEFPKLLSSINDFSPYFLHRPSSFELEYGCIGMGVGRDDDDDDDEEKSNYTLKGCSLFFYCLKKLFSPSSQARTQRHPLISSLPTVIIICVCVQGSSLSVAVSVLSSRISNIN